MMIRGSDDVLAGRLLQQFHNLKAERDLHHGIDYDLEAFVPPPPPDPSRHRQLLTVMFTDIVDSSASAAKLGDRLWGEILEKHHDIIRRAVRRRRGRHVKEIGDGSLSTFDSPTQAVLAAQGIISDMEPLGIEVRIGLHAGEFTVIGTEDDIRGTVVDIAARVSVAAGASELLVSRTVKDLMAGSVVNFQERGIHDLKGVGSWVLYAVPPLGDTPAGS